MSPTEPTGARASAFDAFPLLCPVCGKRLARRAASLVCPGRHTFDIARQGYVNLAAGRSLVGDTAAMVADRQAFLAAGHYRCLTDRVAEVAAGALRPSGGLVVDAGGGVGHYLASVLERAQAAVGLVLDSSVAALRRAGRVHPRMAAVGGDVWARWPLPDRAVDVVLDVFAPRNPAEFHRVLRPDGLLVVVTPGADHLAELRGTGQLIGVDERKEERLERALGSRFRTQAREELSYAMRLDAAAVGLVTGMGPSAHHRDPGEPAPGSGPLTVTASFVITTYRPVGTV